MVVHLFFSSRSLACSALVSSTVGAGFGAATASGGNVSLTSGSPTLGGSDSLTPSPALNSSVGGSPPLRPSPSPRVSARRLRPGFWGGARQLRPRLTRCFLGAGQRPRQGAGPHFGGGRAQPHHGRRDVGDIREGLEVPTEVVALDPLNDVGDTDGRTHQPPHHQ